MTGFKGALFGKKEAELDKWAKETEALEIDELESFINGIKRDITAVKNAIRLDYNNGLAEGSVNKLKVVKRIMYGRNSFELLKNPIMAEFLGFKNEDSYLESDLEAAIISHIRDFLMEMGRGFAFVARQQHIVTETEDYYIDLVFYNIELKCYVLIDLKMGKITHQDVGQIDMYVRMYDDLKCKPGDNPTIGILLCSETDEDIARYSVLHDNDHLFMSKYLTCLPTKEQLKVEIERQKEIFYMQHPDAGENDGGEEGYQRKN